MLIHPAAIESAQFAAAVAAMRDSSAVADTTAAMANPGNECHGAHAATLFFLNRERLIEIVR